MSIHNSLVLFALLVAIFASGGSAQNLKSFPFSLPHAGGWLRSAVLPDANGTHTVIFGAARQSLVSLNCSTLVVAFNPSNHGENVSFINMTTSRCSPGVFIGGNKVFFMGGTHHVGSYQDIDTYEAFAVTDGVLSADLTGNLSSARYTDGHHSQAPGFASLTRVMAFQGRTSSSPSGVTNVDYIDVATGAKTTATVSPGASGYGSASFILNGKPYTAFVGGSGNFGFFGPYYTNIIRIYDHQSQQYYSMPNPPASLSVARGDLTAVVVNNKYLLAIGGHDIGSGTGSGPRALVDVFDLSQMTSSMSPPRIATLNLTTARYEAGAAVLGPYVYVAGGLGQCSSCPLSSIEVIDTRDWSIWEGPSLPLPLRAVAAASVPSFGVLFAGGYNDPSNVASENISYITCGNGLVEDDEGCDSAHDLNCAKNCSSCLNGLTYNDTVGICCDSSSSSSVPCVPPLPTLVPSPVASPPPSVATPSQAPQESPSFDTPTDVPPSDSPSSSSALQCYVGTSQAGINTILTPTSCSSSDVYCQGTWQKIGGVTQFTYSCGGTSCVSFNQLGIQGACCCQGDLCNMRDFCNSSSAKSILAALLILLVAFLMHH